MRIHFRASHFGQVAKINIVRAIETRFLCVIGCGNDARVICSLARVIKQIGFWTQKIQANVDHCYVWRREQTRRVQFARPWTQASKPALTESSLAAKRRASALHVVFFSTKHPSPARLPTAAVAYSRMMHSHEKTLAGCAALLVL